MARIELKSYLSWAKAAGPFWQYVAATPFYVGSCRKPAPPPLSLGQRIVNESILPLLGTPSHRVALLLDLPLELGLATTMAFQEAEWIVVPVIYRWPSSHPILPIDTILAELVWLSERLHQPEDARGVAFLLDGERRSTTRSATLTHRFDNRYTYPPDVLPPAKMLQAWGARVAAVAGHYHQPPHDVEEIVSPMEKSGLSISRIWVRSD